MKLTDVKEDSRGTILKFKIGSNKFLVIFTKKGALRAGETHNIDQSTFLIKGKVEVIQKVENIDLPYTYHDYNHSTLIIPKGVPHYFRFLEDSIMIEIEEEGMTTEYYPEYRKLVEKSMNDIH